MSAQVEKAKAKGQRSSRSSASVPALAVSEGLQIRRHLFSVDDYHSMVDAGVLKEIDEIVG
jgi:hypothetical protein